MSKILPLALLVWLATGVSATADEADLKLIFEKVPLTSFPTIYRSKSEEAKQRSIAVDVASKLDAIDFREIGRFRVYSYFCQQFGKPENIEVYFRFRFLVKLSREAVHDDPIMQEKGKNEYDANFRETDRHKKEVGPLTDSPPNHRYAIYCKDLVQRYPSYFQWLK